MRLSFLGAAGTVTGSKYLLQRAERMLLVDCGLFQGQAAIRQRNWQALPFHSSKLNTIVLTHAHLDHSGYLPLLVKNGFRGRVYCTASTAELLAVLLPDSGYLQEKDAEFANRHKYSKHSPAAPLYTERDARHALEFLSPVEFGTEQSLGDDIRIIFERAGHILGAASVQLFCDRKVIVFSGDIGRYGDPVLPDPTPIDHADYLIIESTYGDRLHDKIDPETALADIVVKTTSRGGTVVIPAFAVGRAQSLLFHLQKLRSAGTLGNVPVFLDSPMAVDASEILCRNMKDHRLSEAECRKSCGIATYVRSTEDSKALTANPMPKIIISASGMATGGRVLHHLKRYAPDFRSSILFAGFQAPGTRGAEMLAGAKAVRIHGEDIAVKAQVKNLSMLSAHADADELMRWMRGFRKSPRLCFVTHGEPQPASALSNRIQQELGWRCKIPEHLDTSELDG